MAALDRMGGVYFGPLVLASASPGRRPGSTSTQCVPR